MQAESAYQRALVIRPDDTVAYEGLAEIYNTQRRFNDAAEASAQAVAISGAAMVRAEGGDAGVVFNQGLILWNAGRIPEARQQFERTLELDPDRGEAHYWLAMVNLNGGKASEAAAVLKVYLDLKPDGRYAAEATGILVSIEP